jgi:hypothetical protein
LPEDYIRREAGKAFVDGVEDSDIKINLLLGGEKILREAPRQTLQLHTELIVVRSPKANNGTS